MTRKIKLEGSLVVELKDGREVLLTSSPFNGKVRFNAGMPFDPVELMDEQKFRDSIKRVVSRSRYDSR